MWRYQALCGHCGLASVWQGHREECLQGLLQHLEQEHQNAGGDAAAYELREQRQCDYCLGEFIDSCTKCGRDFCHLHAGDIDGLCGGCI